MLFKRDESQPSQEDFQRFNALLNEVLAVRNHLDLMTWLQGSLQHYLTHEILIAAWGDFHLGLIYYDIISAMPGVRTENATAKSLAPLLKGMFEQWAMQDREPFFLNVGHEGVTWEGLMEPGSIADAMTTMNSALVHGINDQRGRHDCLYMFFSRYPKRRHSDKQTIRMLLPYIDAAMRQVELLSHQHPSKPAPVEVAHDADGGVLSDREAEIMHWVGLGKTNSEIGSILNVSAFTVKNHMQRIFKKLDVLNRAQAVAAYREKYTPSSETASRHG
ncbi:transcriptional regulator EpsA [Curvibacter sp. CHRR-16]|uniref:XrtB/PEP-CTERM-associated transcriptional regulator EpsA n=1 Tax=Curvibacter sp. CHRR-16 TaxID=2835872 RepID=UPI001BDA1074|nr:XrtB/PEP-CTERM-associated transcriptional regulator EpsA [Curvibacter sp. CHRR-16]MBT0571539.1 transcriptional regulator EpsA [Curvibacter sp. CHRR-16]